MKRTAVLMLVVIMMLCTMCNVSAANVVTITMDYDSSQGIVSFGNVVRADGAVLEVYAGVYNFKIQPADGYEVDNVTVSEGSSVVFDATSANITANANTVLAITFKKIQVQTICSITMDIEGGNGTVNFAGADRVNGWSGEVFSGNFAAGIKPDAGYYVHEVYLNDTKLTVVDKTVKFDLVENSTLRVILKKICTVTIEYDETYGTVDFLNVDRANGDKEEVYQGYYNAHIKPNENCYIHEVYLNDTKLTVNNNAVNFNVTDDSVLRVTFKKVVKISVKYDERMGEVKCGNVIPNGGYAEVFNVGNTDFVITPKAGYVISKVMYDGEDNTVFVKNGVLRVDCKESMLEVTFKAEEKAPFIEHARHENGITYLTINSGNIGGVKEAGIMFGTESVGFLRLIGYSEYDKETESGTPVISGALGIKVASVGGLTEKTAFDIIPFVTYSNAGETIDSFFSEQFTQEFDANN